MASSRTPDEILSAWRASIDADQETGAFSSLSLGESDSLVDALPGLAACRRLVLTRTDVSAPWVLAGGGSALWYCLAVHVTNGNDAPRSTNSAVVQPALRPFYAGADPATVMASNTLQTSVLYGDRTHRAQVGPSSLPGGMASRLAPATQLGAVEPWESLPFSIMEPVPTSSGKTSADWSAYAALMLAVFLLLVALFI